MRYLYRISVFLFMIFLSQTCTAQNAFYDAQRISRYMHSGKQDSIIPILMNYCPEGKQFPWVRLISKYPDHIKRLENITYPNSQLKLMEVLNDSSKLQDKLRQSTSPDLPRLRSVITAYYLRRNRFNTLQKFSSDLQQHINDADRHFWPSDSTAFMALFGEASFDTLRELIVTAVSDSSKTTLSDMELQQMADSMKSYAARQTTASEEDMNKAFITVYELAKEKEIYQILFITDQSLVLSENDKQLISGTAKERDFSENQLNAVSNRPVAGFSMPSQAEMIDALAIYLAKRVKQEVAIAFIDKLSGYIREQAILTTLFPSTLQLLNNRDAFAKPKFGTAWQIALSEDFLKIPDNLSKCLPSKYGYVQNYLLDAVQIGQLVQQKYSFTEGVNRLHDEALLKSDALNYSNTMLYVLNHEFYDTRNEDHYWVSGEALQRLKTEDLEWLYILLDIRYGESINQMMNSRWADKRIWNQQFFEKKVYPFRNWVSRILVQLNHFESDLKQASLNTNSTMGEKLAGYWKFQNNLMEVVIDSNFIRLPKEAYKYIDYTRSVFTLYSAIDSKNYPLLVDEILKLFSNLGLDKDIDLQDVIYNRQFSTALKQADPQVQEDLSNLFKVLNTQYGHLLEATELPELSVQYRQLLRKLNDRQKISALNKKMSIKEFSSFLVGKLNGQQDIDWTTELFTASFRDELTNNAGRNKDILTLINAMNSNFQHLKDLRTYIEQGQATFKTIQKVLHESKLDDKDYSRIRSGDLQHFVTEKMLTFEAPLYQPFLNRVENRSQYKKILTTLSFLSDVMQSDNSRELSNVIEAYSLPASSYRIKRHSRFSVNVDALAGGYAGVEFLKKTGNTSNASAVAGLSAPIGISFNWGKRGKVNKTYELKQHEVGFMNRHGDFKVLKGYNFSLMATVVDIGAVVSYRITDKADGGLPADAKWSQFFSPGLMGILGLPGLPLCVGTGVRFTPKLRSLGTGVQANALRFDVGVYFDLPLLSVWYR